MMRSLLGALREPQLSQLAAAAEPWIDETPAAIRSALDMLVPVVLNALIDRAETIGDPHKALADLHGFVIDPAIDELVAAPKTWPELASRVIGNGARIADQVFPEYRDEVVRAVAGLANVKTWNAWCLFTALLPLALSVLRRALRAERLDADAYYDLLVESRHEVRLAMHAKLAAELQECGALRESFAPAQPRSGMPARAIGAAPSAMRGMFHVPITLRVKKFLLGRR